MAVRRPALLLSLVCAVVLAAPTAAEAGPPSRNDVRHSAGWGIHVPGAVDLGGNRASGNGNQPQCVGVVCAS